MDKKVLTVLGAVLLVVLILLGLQRLDRNTERHNTIGNSVNEVIEEVKDEVDDHTTGQ